MHGLNPLLALALPELTTTLWTMLGIGLVIFVHEFGHFLAARACGVAVEVFSLGFGPRLFGFERNGTDYRISAVPIGGYVKMRGDQPGEGKGDPRALNSRGVGVRALVYSGGVAMNMVFAFVAFPILFAVGVRMEAPKIGSITPGGAAWKAGLKEGDEILAINGRELFSFNDIQVEVALSDPARTRLSIRRGDAVREVAVHPEYVEAYGSYALQVGQSNRYRVLVEPGGAAEKAGLESGDQLIALAGAPASRAQETLAELVEGGPVKVEVEKRDGRRAAVELQPAWTPTGEGMLGVRAPRSQVKALRGALARGPLEVDDVVIAVDGKPLLDSDELDAAAPGAHALSVARDGRTIEVPLDAAQFSGLADDVAFGICDRDPFGEGVGVVVTRGSAAESAGLASGVRIRSVGGEPIEKWTDLQQQVRGNGGKPLAVEVEGPGAAPRRELTIAPRPQPLPEFGFDLEVEPETVVRRYAGVEAIQQGMASSWNMARQAYVMLKKMVSRQVSTENLGSIVSISVVSYQFAKQGLSKLFYFLALLSINLAVINVLPIPLLDGGHLLFLLIEKLKGSPVDDRVMGYSQVVGFTLILGLLIYVIKNDIVRIVHQLG